MSEKLTLFHGTSADNLESILKNGLSCDETKIWNASEDAVYFWSAQHIAKYEEGDESFQEYDHNHWKHVAFLRAADNANCTLASSEANNTIVIEVELDEKDVEEDRSCPNMEGAVCYRGNIKPEKIKSIKISSDLGWLKPLMLSSLLKRIFFNGDNVSYKQQQIARLFEDVSVDPCEVEELTDWEDVSLS